MEATVTAFRPLLSDHVVAASAAERLAIIQIVARLVASPSGNARVIDVGSLLAEIRRPLVEDEVGVADAPGELASFTAASGFVAQLRLVHQDGLVESLLEDGPDVPEFGHRFPARFYLATSTHSMAAATNLPIGSHHLDVGTIIISETDRVAQIDPLEELGTGLQFSHGGPSLLPIKYDASPSFFRSPRQQFHAQLSRERGAKA